MNAITTTSPSAQQHKLGRRFIAAEACSYPPAVMADDVLMVDLDVNTVTVDGLYLLERLDDLDNVVWMGCRRLELSIFGGVNVVEITGEVVPFDRSDVHIAGRVLRVYRPTGNMA
jgi:hypothetical protein